MTSEIAESRVTGSGVYVKRFRDVCHEFGVVAVEAAMHWVRARSGATKIIIGVERADDLKDAYRVMNMPLSTVTELVAALDDVSMVPRSVRDPRMWTKHGA